MILGLTERRVCRVLGQPRWTQRYRQEPVHDEGPLTQAIIALESQYDRYGYRQVRALLRNDEGAEETTTSAAALAHRWLLRPAPSGTAEPCVGV